MKVFAFEALGEMEEQQPVVKPEELELTPEALESLAVFLSWFAKDD